MTDQMKKTLSRIGRIVCTLTASSTITFAAGCIGGIPDQEQFAPLSSLKTNGQATVRLYGLQDPLFGSAVRHTWFLVKHAGSTNFDRWELWGELEGEYGHVFKNLFDLEEGAFGLRPFIIAELIGPEAEPIVEFIETESPNYPYKDVFDIVKGPNCHTYTMWIKENTGWDLPFQGITLSMFQDYDLPGQ